MKQILTAFTSILLAVYSYSQTNVFPDTGNVGIGTVNPKQKLDLLGNLLLNSEDASLANNIVNSSSIIFRSSGYATDNKARYQLWTILSMGKSTWGSGDLIFQSNTDGMGYNERVRFSANGNVGIGTSDLTNGWKLAVNGNIRAKEIKVETGWSDFVFYDDYKLPTLQEVENHIKEKGHLKDIPSAKEVEENGIFLGEMDAKLLQKIEELTLYTIQQEKKIQKLEEENRKLKALSGRVTEIEKLINSKNQN
ncbi:hypothetical protein [Ascidiimonas aurantiaca]|uniref:hypothetical protein n=1 Tax=Ascidiimonas aurantiaca TaxID=1685432 RepID=UPI0030EEECDE